jgi:hypothetical protein
MGKAPRAKPTLAVLANAMNKGDMDDSALAKKYRVSIATFDSIRNMFPDLIRVSP